MNLNLQPAFFQPQSLTVSELTRYLRALLESDEVLQGTWVQGEISNLSRPSSGHVYFTLKDPFSALRCVMWKSQAQRLPANLQNGMQVEAHGSIGIYERDGAYQLYADTLRPLGAGRLYQEFLRLKAALEAEGLFDAERKRPIPPMPRRIGLVTSPTGAALQDMLNTLRQRYPLAEVILSPTAVQGAEAPLEICRALSRLALDEQVDVILVARGGGSLEDLWAFNDENVVRAIAHSPVPVITGIGHETDFTLADFAADQRAPTPTGAAMMATPERGELLAALNNLQGRLDAAFFYHLDRGRSALLDLQRRLQSISPAHRFLNDRQRVDTLEARLQSATVQDLRLRRARLLGLNGNLRSLNPLSVLERGFAVVYHPRGGLVLSSRQVQAGDVVQIRFAEGSAEAAIQQAHADDDLSRQEKEKL